MRIEELMIRTKPNGAALRPKRLLELMPDGVNQVVKLEAAAKRLGKLVQPIIAQGSQVGFLRGNGELRCHKLGFIDLLAQRALDPLPELA